MKLYYGTGLEDARGIVKHRAVLSLVEQRRRDLKLLFTTQESHTQYGKDLDSIARKMYGKSFEEYALSFVRGNHTGRDLERNVKSVTLTDHPTAVSRSRPQPHGVVLGFSLDLKELLSHPLNAGFSATSPVWFVNDKVDLTHLSEVHLPAHTFHSAGPKVYELFKQFEVPYFIVRRGQVSRVFQNGLKG